VHGRVRKERIEADTAPETEKSSRETDQTRDQRFR
jgi:hypothetical protein